MNSLALVDLARSNLHGRRWELRIGGGLVQVAQATKPWDRVQVTIRGSWQLSGDENDALGGPKVAPLSTRLPFGLPAIHDPVPSDW